VRGAGVRQVGSISVAGYGTSSPRITLSASDLVVLLVLANHAITQRDFVLLGDVRPLSLRCVVIGFAWSASRLGLHHGDEISDAPADASRAAVWAWGGLAFILSGVFMSRNL